MGLLSPLSDGTARGNAFSGFMGSIRRIGVCARCVGAPPDGGGSGYDDSFARSHDVRVAQGRGGIGRWWDSARKLALSRSAPGWHGGATSRTTSEAMPLEGWDMRQGSCSNSV